MKKQSIKLQFLNAVSFTTLKEKSQLTNLQSVIILLLISHDLKKQLSINTSFHIVPSKCQNMTLNYKGDKIKNGI